MKSTTPVPDSPAAWLKEIAKAYADAHDAIPFGKLVGQGIRPEDLFHLGPVTCLKFRGIPRTKELLDKATTAALSSYVATQEHSAGNLAVPQLAFAFAYLASHFGLDILDADEINVLMEYIEQNQAKLLELTEEP